MPTGRAEAYTTRLLRVSALSGPITGSLRELFGPTQQFDSVCLNLHLEVNHSKHAGFLGAV